MSININSEAACKKAYLNYHCYGNTMGISDKEMGEITSAWSGRLASWQATVSKDENKYEFDDSEFSQSKAKGKQAAQDATGYKGGKGNMVGRGVGDAAWSVGSAIGMKGVGKGLSALGKGAGKIGMKGAEKGLNKAGEAVTNAAGKEVGKGSAKKGAAKLSDIVTVSMTAASLAMYLAKKPNKEQVDAAKVLRDEEMPAAQAALTDSQAEMEEMSEELISLSDEANEANEEANEQIEEEKSQYDMFMESFVALKEKAESGEALTDGEKELYESLVESMGESGEVITEMSEDATDVVSDIYGDMETYQEGYDAAADTMGEVQGLTDFAESFDGATKTMCFVEAGVQGLNGISAGLAAVKLMGKGPVGWAFAALGYATAAGSAVTAAEQIGMAKEVGQEIDARQATQDFNTETMDMYTEEVDAYDGFMTDVEDLELEIPDDIEPPEDTTLPNQSEEKDPVPETLKPKEEKDK